jgi:LemA protein
MVIVLLLLGAAAFVIVAGIGIYNRLVGLKHGTKAAWSNIDVLLKQRHDELPKLIETCKQHMKFEQDTLERVIRARSAVNNASVSGDLTALGAAETELRSGLGRLFAVAEAYPELKASVSFQQLQSRISVLETSISDRRELYNEAVNVNNVAIEQFPASVIAGMFAFAAAKLLEFSDAETADVDVKALFN